MTQASLPSGDAKMPDKDQGDDQSVVPTLTKDLIRMIESSKDGRLDLKDVAQELKAPRSTLDFVSNFLEGIQFLKRISSDVVQMMDMPDREKLTKRLDESWKEGSTVDEWISRLKSLGFSSPDGKESEGEDKSSEAKQTPNRAQNDESTGEETQVMEMRTLLSPYSTSPSSTTTSTSYPRPARRRTTPVYIFGQSTPFKKQFTPSDRLVQVSSEDTDESNPSSKSDASNFSTPESLPHPLSPAATIRNARSRVLLLANSPDHEPVASPNSSNTRTTRTAKKASNNDDAPSPAAAAAAKTAQDFRKKRVPSYVSNKTSGDEVNKRPKK